MKLQIIVHYESVHPEFGGKRREDYIFSLEEAKLAEAKFNELRKDDTCFGYSYTTINISEVSSKDYDKGGV